MSKFYLSDSRSPSPTPSTTSTSSSTDSLSLPYPAPLQRTDFLDPNFTPSTYLSTRRSQHQTLEDLRTELRQRSQLLSKELLDLVNSNYQDFLNLGNSLHGGEEKVEEDSDDDEEEDEDEDDDNQGAYGMPIAKLERNALQYRLVQEMEKGIQGHPFLAAQTHRMVKVRSTLLLDLSTALGQAKNAGTKGSGRLMKIMKIYADMDESAEAVKVLRSLKTT